MSFNIFKRINEAPPSGYCFIDPDTGYRFDNHKSLKSLIEAVNKYRENNALEPILDVYYAVQDYMCSLPINKYNNVCRKVERLENITFSQFVTGGKYYLSKKIKRWFGIDKEKGEDFLNIEKRRSLCAKCPFNVPLDNTKSGFSIRQEIKALMDADFPEIVTEHDEGLGVCAVCNCSTLYKSCLPEKDIADSVRKMPRSKRESFPESAKGRPEDLDIENNSFNCWQKSNYNKFYVKKE